MEVKGVVHVFRPINRGEALKYIADLYPASATN